MTYITFENEHKCALCRQWKNTFIIYDEERDLGLCDECERYYEVLKEVADSASKISERLKTATLPFYADNLHQKLNKLFIAKPRESDT